MHYHLLSTNMCKFGATYVSAAASVCPHNNLITISHIIDKQLKRKSLITYSVEWVLVNVC